jgi:CTP synthase
MRKYVFVTGGVISSVGKGIVSSSIGNLLKSSGYKVTNIKCDMYVNIDAGTIRPTEHGEVFVTTDGVETDQDLGNYERFTEQDTNWMNYITTGQIYQEVIKRERNFEYDGEDVEVVPHVPQEIVRRIRLAGKSHDADVVVVEFGGTVGEYQVLLFLEAARMLKIEEPENVVFAHVAYLPTPPSVGEMKSKPAQYSIRSLNGAGIFPDFVICRAERELDEPRRKSLSNVCAIPDADIFSCPDVESVYTVPEVLHKQGFTKRLLHKLGLPQGEIGVSDTWQKLINTIRKEKKIMRIGMVGKYFDTGNYVLEDSYVCVIEALKHAAWSLDLTLDLRWFNAKIYDEHPEKVEELREMQGIVFPGGYGVRGLEGKILGCQFVREQKIPALGLCLGMQMMVVEYARNVLGLKDAHTEEAVVDGKNPVIHMMEYQKELLKERRYGGTNRLGAYPCVLTEGTKTFAAYGTKEISERHRHRYEYNNTYRADLEKAGLLVAGTSPDGSLVEIVEVKDHPFMVGVQFHPEFISRPCTPHPLFRAFLTACIE